MASKSSKILVLGPPGGGKSTSARNMNPKTTGIISPDRKELPLEGWIDNYVTIFDKDGVPDLMKSNFVEPSIPSSVVRTFEAWDQRPDLDTILIDTVTQMIMADYVGNAIGKDYKEYQKMGKNFYLLMDLMRDSQKNIVIYAHSELIFNEMGDRVIQMATPGKMIQSFSPPSFFTTVLITHMERKEKKNSFYFRTQPDSINDPVKNPVRFRTENGVEIAENALNYLEPNDIKVVLDKLEAFRRGPQKTSEIQAPTVVKESKNG